MANPQARFLSVKLKDVNWTLKPPQSLLTLRLTHDSQVRTAPLQASLSDSESCSSVSEAQAEHVFDVDSSVSSLAIDLFLPNGELFYADTINLQLVDCDAEVLLVIKNRGVIYAWILLQLSWVDKRTR
jgi:hypothetical protein